MQGAGATDAVEWRSTQSPGLMRCVESIAPQRTRRTTTTLVLVGSVLCWSQVQRAPAPAGLLQASICRVIGRVSAVCYSHIKSSCPRTFKSEVCFGQQTALLPITQRPHPAPPGFMDSGLRRTPDCISPWKLTRHPITLMQGVS